MTWTHFYPHHFIWAVFSTSYICTDSLILQFYYVISVLERFDGTYKIPNLCSASKFRLFHVRFTVVVIYIELLELSLLIEEELRWVYKIINFNIEHSMFFSRFRKKWLYGTPKISCTFSKLAVLTHFRSMNSKPVGNFFDTRRRQIGFTPYRETL